MKGTYFLGNKQFETKEIDLREIREDEVLLKVEACGICGTDVHIYHGDKGSAEVVPPVILGHELAGIVEQIGSRVSTVKVGDHVTVDPNIYCGKCHYCKSRISPRYLILEVFTALLFTVVWLQVFAGLTIPEDLGRAWLTHGNDLLAPPCWRYGLTPLLHPALLPVYWLVLWGLILGTFVDLEHYILPDRVTIGGMVAGVVLSPLVPELHFTASWSTALLRSVLGLAVGFGGLWLIAILGELAFKKEAMGFGDVKLMGAIGAFFGWKAVLFVLLSASLFGSIVGVGLIALGKRQLQGRIPFGPFLALGTLIWMFWGRALVSAYMRFLLPPMA